LRPGVSIEAANAELAAISRHLAHEHPDTNVGMEAGAVPLQGWLVGPVRRPLGILLAAAGLVLLIAVANVAHLRLARQAARQREYALRGCLGASRWRLVRRALVESLVLAGCGGALGALLAWRGTPLLVRLAGDYLPRASEVSVDAVAFSFAAAAALGAAILSGLSAARRGGGVDLERGLREGGRGGASRRERRVRQRLVAAEVALATVVVVGAVLLVRTVVALERVPAGFDPRGVVTATVTLPGASYPKEADLDAFVTRFLGAVRAQPGVQAAGLVSKLPLTDDSWSSDFAIAGRAREDFGIGVLHRELSPGYFAALRVPLVAGRAFRD